MSIRARVSVLALLAVVTVAGAASAQTWTAEQQEVWKLEEQQWQMAKDEDLSWVDTMLHPNVSAWAADRPMPQNKASIARWNRYDSASGTVLEQELFPISITITGNIAVANYRYVIARENEKKERVTATGRYMDVLIKEGGRWLFIAWAGGDDPRH
jgi:hypothetical protein